MNDSNNLTSLAAAAHALSMETHLGGRARHAAAAAAHEAAAQAAGNGPDAGYHRARAQAHTICAQGMSE